MSAFVFAVDPVIKARARLCRVATDSPLRKLINRMIYLSTGKSSHLLKLTLFICTCFHIKYGFFGCNQLGLTS